MHWSTAILMGWLILAAPAYAGTTGLQIEDTIARAGQTTTMNVILSNEAPVRGLQFTLAGLPRGMHLDGVAPKGRATRLRADAHQTSDGRVNAILISLGEQLVETGKGPVLEMRFSVAPGAEPGDFKVMPADVAVAGASGELAAEVQPARLRLEERSSGGRAGGCNVDRGATSPSHWAALVSLLLVAARAAVKRAQRRPTARWSDEG